MHLVLVSVSPTRRTTLIAAGITPIIQVFAVDEDTVLAASPGGHTFSGCTITPTGEVAALTVAKCADVRKVLSMSGTNAELPEDETALVVDCGSVLEIDSRMLGKPHTPDIVRERVRTMRRTSATLWTDHSAAILAPALSSDDQGHEHMITAVVTRSASIQVHFGDVSGAEVDAYVAAGEPLHAAGSLMVGGLGGSFIEGVTGDYHPVAGTSLPLLRSITAEFGVFWPDL